MELSRISISNFRNFSAIDVSLAGSVVVVGENRVGKSNLLYALRLLLDPTFADSARQLSFSDFWDGLKVPAADPETVRLVYEFRPRAGLEDDPESEEDFEFICYGGELGCLNGCIASPSA